MFGNTWGYFMNSELVGITLKKMMDMDILKNSKVIAGESGIESIVTRINVMEVPDILDWVTPGEFLLTTAYAIKDNLNILLDLIPSLQEKKVVGIGLKTRRYVEKLPDSVIELANSLSFPIIEIPINLGYTDIIVSVLTEITKEQSKAFYEIRRIHERFLENILNGSGIESIVNVLSELCDNSVAIWDMTFNNFISSFKSENASELESIIKLDEESYKINYCNYHKVTLRKKDILNGVEVIRLMIPVCIDNKQVGCLFVWEDNRKISVLDNQIITSAIPFIALEFTKKMSVYEIESRHKLEFFDDLISDDPIRNSMALERSIYYNFNKDLGYLVIVIKAEDILLPKNTEKDSDHLFQFYRSFMQNIELLARKYNNQIFYINKSNQILILYSLAPDTTQIEAKKSAVEFCYDFLSTFDSKSKKINCNIGIGRFYKSVSNLSKSYNEAFSAATIDLRNSKNVMHYDDLGVYRILQSADFEEQKKFYTEFLGDLIKYDDEKKLDILKTLDMYFQCSGNLKKISEAMFTHYNTILYRVQRIEEITGLNLRNYDDILNLQMALKIYLLIS